MKLKLSGGKISEISEISEIHVIRGKTDDLCSHGIKQARVETRAPFFKQNVDKSVL